MTLDQQHGKDCWGNDPEWPMYSYDRLDRPAYILWNAIAKNLHRRGWTDEQIKTWLASKNARWALDFNLGETIQKLGDEWATKNVGSFRKEMRDVR